MKLAAPFCIAALSLVGCADVETINGGHTAGMRPAKPSLTVSDDPKVPLNPETTGVNQRGFYQMPEGLDNFGGITVDTVKDGDYPLPEEVCGGCQVQVVSVPPHKTQNSFSEYGELHIINDGGYEICRIFVNNDGSLDARDCSK